MKKRLLWFLPAIMAVMAVAVPTTVLAAVTYYIPIVVANSGAGSDYDELPIIESINNDNLADQGYIGSEGLDTRVTYSGSALKHMVTDAKTAFVAENVNKGVTYNFQYTMGNDPITNFAIIPGYGGSISRADTPDMELGDNFTIEQSGYVDTSAGSNKNLVWKNGAFRTYIDSASSITSVMNIFDGQSIFPLTPSVDVATVAGAWTDVDANSYSVPAGATGILFHVASANADVAFGIRKNGSGDTRNGVMEGSSSTHYWGMIGIDTDGIFEYWAGNATNIALYITGYTTSGVTYNLNGENISLGGTGAWTDIDCSSWAPGATAIIVEIVNTSTTAYTGGIRPDGSSSAVTLASLGDGAVANAHVFQVVGCSTSQIIEGQISNVAVDFYGIGYITSGVTMATDPTDKSLGGTGAWTDINCSAQSTVNTIALFFSATGNSNNLYGFRKNGSPEDITKASQYIGTPFSIVECDSSQIVEGYISNVAMDFYLWGYAEGSVGTSKSVTATVASGVHSIKTTADGTDLKLYVDSVEKDSEALAGASVTNNGNAWYWMQNNVCCYLDYLKITTAVGGTSLKAHYEPDSMIIGDTLPDETANDYDATFSWGSNPGTVSVSHGALQILNLAQMTTEEEVGPLQIFGEVPQEPGGFFEAENYGALPGANVINELATAGQIPLKLFWVPMLIIAVIFIGLWVFSKTRHIMGVAIGSCIILGIFTAIGMLPWWVMVPYTIMAVTMIVAEKTYGF